MRKLFGFSHDKLHWKGQGGLFFLLWAPLLPPHPTDPSRCDVKLCFLCVFVCLLYPVGGTRHSGSRLSSLSFCVWPDYTHSTHCALNVYRRAHRYSDVIYITSEQSEPNGSFVSHFKSPVSAKPKKKGLFHKYIKERVAPHADFFHCGCLNTCPGGFVGFKNPLASSNADSVNWLVNPKK